MNSSIKLLLIVREPLTRAISDYTQLMSNNIMPSSSTNASISNSQQPQQSTFEQLTLFENGSINAFYKPIMTSTYHYYMYKWLDLFPKQQIHVVDGEVLIENPVEEIRKIELFLNLKPKIQNHNFYFNRTKGFYCFKNDQNNWCLSETKGRKHPRINPFLATRIRQYFQIHNQRFYDLIHEHFDWPTE